MTKLAHDWRPTRRGMLATTLGTATAGAAALLPSGGVFASGSERIRIGLIGCGGRGTGAASQAAAAHPSVRIVAMGDLFHDHIEESASMLHRDIGHQFEATPSRRFVGHDAWQQVLDAGIDAVILAATPWSRPIHLTVAIARRVHVYAERPGAADLEGVHAAVTACAEARARGLVVVSGFSGRHHGPTIETVCRVRSGDIGQLLRAECRAAIGLPWYRPTSPSRTAEERRQRNWVTERDLSGGPLLERHLDAIDRGLQIFGDACPITASPMPTASGAAIRYRFATGADLVAQITRVGGSGSRIDERVSGSAGTADLIDHRIAGASSWRYDGPAGNPWQNCMSFFVQEILGGGHGDGGLPLCQSTLTAILGQRALDLGRTVAWSEVERPTAGMTGII